MQAVLKTLLYPLRMRMRIKSIGYIHSMDDYEKRKLGIFNVLNVLGFFIGAFLPLTALSISGIDLSTFAWVVTFSPGMVSILVLILNYYRQHEVAALAYFIMYPVLTAMVYKVSFDVGCELFFILYGVLSVFFLRKFLHVLLAFTLTFLCYFFVFVYKRDYPVAMVDINFPFYVMAHIVPAIFIFYALVLIKKENTGYQLHILESNKELHRVNMEIQKQNAIIDEKARLLQNKNEIIDEKARLLQKKTRELTEMNTMKTKLFSVISHDLKGPLYALRNLFRTVQQYDMPADEIKQFVPEVIKDLNYTTALMENLLIWVKSQMQVNVMHPQLLEIGSLVKETTDLLHLSAANKRIQIDVDIKAQVFIYADKDMISLVIRNLVSNAVKFTPEDGHIFISAREKANVVEIQVKDSGVGMDSEMIAKLFGNIFYTTKGTANESGTGLGLMLCKDFLTRNGGELHVESTPGKGSTFVFTLPRKMKA